MFQDRVREMKDIDDDRKMCSRETVIYDVKKKFFFQLNIVSSGLLDYSN